MRRVFLKSRLKILREMRAELWRTPWVRRMSAAYTIATVAYWIAKPSWPALAALADSGPEIRALLSIRSWTIVALLLIIVFIIDAAFRVKRRALGKQAKMHRDEIGRLRAKLGDAKEQLERSKPKLEGEIQDLIMMGLTGNDDSQACGIWLRAYIFNSTDCKTGIKNFRFRVETANQALESLYAEEGKIPQTYEDAPTRHSMLRGEIEAKQFPNLADMDKGETITKGEPIEGHLHFRMPRPNFKDFNFNDVTLIVTDTFGNDHPLPYKHTPMLPSKRIMVPQRDRSSLK